MKMPPDRHWLVIMTVVCNAKAQVLGPSFLINSANGSFTKEWSPSQISKVPDVEFLIVPGTSLDTTTTLVTNRYLCSSIEGYFSVNEKDRSILDLTLFTTWDKGDKPKCDVNWGDGSSEEVALNPDSIIDVQHAYSDFGVYIVKLECSDDAGNSQSCPVQNAVCAEAPELFDNVFKSIDTPLKFFVNERIQFDSFLSLKDSCLGQQPGMNWRLDRINGSTLVSFTNFKQPNNSVLTFEPYILEPGFYVLYLELTFYHLSINSWNADYIFVNIILPELVATISGGSYITVPHGTTFTVDASRSNDPVATLESIAGEEISAKWGFANYPINPSESDRYSFTRFFPANPLPDQSNIYFIRDGDEYLLTVDSSYFPADTYCVVMFSLKRGERASSVIQWIYLAPGAFPVTLSCIKNCHAGRERKFLDDEIMLDSVLPYELQNVTGVTYSWSIEYLYYFTSLGIVPYYGFLSDSLAATQTSTGLYSRSIGILKGALVPGLHYRIRVDVSVPGYTASTAWVTGNVNYVPYAGNCALDRTSGVAASDWFVFTCSNWKGADDRVDVIADADVNPMLTISVLQMTQDAIVEQEPVLFTKSRRSYIILKVGDPATSYQTTLIIRLSDIYQNFQEITLDVEAFPAFDWEEVSPTQYGADIVTSYLNNDFAKSENQLRIQGKSDLLVPLVSSVASHIHLIHLPVWQPPVPLDLTNGKGLILDLGPGGNKIVGTLDDVINDALTETVDPATVALQTVVSQITTILEDVTVKNVINGTRGEDKPLMSTITNSLGNLAATDQYVNPSVMPKLIFLSRAVGKLSLVSTSENSTNDDSAEIETAAGNANQMTKQIVRTSVPHNLRQLRALLGYHDGRSQISNMLDIAGQNISIENSTLTPDERAYLYYRMQLTSAYEMDGRRETARKAAIMMLELARRVQRVLKLCSVCSNENSSNTDQRVLNNKIANLSEETVFMDSFSFVLEGLANILGENGSSEIASASALELDENVFMYDNDKESSRVSSKILHIDVKYDDQLISPRNITVNQDVLVPEAQVIVPSVDPEDASQFSYHKFIYSSSKDQVCIIIRPENESVVEEYLVYFHFRRPPTILNYEFSVNVSAKSNWQVCILPGKMKGHTGITYLAVEVRNEVQLVKYHFNLITVACMVWEEDLRSWLSDKCDLTWKPDEGQLRCNCHDVKDLTFGNSFFVAPSTIDFTTVFLRFSPLSQAAVIGVLSGLFFIFLVVIIWAVKRDRNDFYRWSITPLLDNFYMDQQFYIIKVFTGMRQGAGTRSRIAFTLFGEKRDTGPRELYDGFRKEFATGSVLTFLMATRKQLGNLVHLRIWHDNTGDDSYGSWYLNQVMVYDIRLRTTYIFPCERWLSVDTSLEANLTSVSEGMTVQFESRFFTHARDRISENHIWMSILYRPISSNFSRVERASCALAYILLTMISSAMYYDTGSDYELPAVFEVGPFRFTPQQIYVSLICALITTPIMMLIIAIFKRTKRKPIYPRTSKKGFCCGCSCRPNNPRIEKILLSEGAMEQRGFYFPHFFLYIAWLLVLGATVTSAFFIVLYSMSWGKQKSEEWLTSFFMSLFESILLVDPFMVLSMSLIFSVIIKFNKPTMGIDFVTLIRNYRRVVNRKTVPVRAVSRPLEGHKLEEERKLSTNRTLAYTALRDICLNLFLMWIICSIAYTNRNPLSYYHHRVIENFFLVPEKLPRFGKIATPEDLYTWLNMTVFPALFPDTDINGDPLHWRERQYMTGIYSYRLGPPRLRQLRVTKGRCDIPNYGSEDCYGHYTITGEDTRDFCLGWKPGPCPETEVVFKYSSRAWKFISALDVWGIPIPGDYTTYGGGGYSIEFDINKNVSTQILNELYTNTWLDRHTRAAILEFTLYTPSTNMFIYNMFMVEFPETGGALTSYTISPLRVYHHYGPSTIYTLICECILVVYLVILLSKICFRLYQQKCLYFSKVWQVYECFQFFTGVTAVVCYFFRLVFTMFTIDKFNEDKRVFVNFQYIVFWDQLLVLFLGILVFTATIRILQVFETSKRVNAVIKVFSDCAGSLFWFGMMFFHILIGFSFLGSLLFGSVLTTYKNVFRTMGTLFISLIGKSNYTDISLVSPVFANIYFIVFIITTVFFVLTIFLSILGGSIDIVIHETRKDNSDDIIETLMKQFQKLMWRPKKNLKTKSQKLKRVRVVPFEDSDRTRDGVKTVSLRL